MDEKIGAISILVVLLAFGLWMFFRHDMGFLGEEMMPVEDDAHSHRRRTARKINFWFQAADVLWSRPVGALLVVCGLSMIPTIFRKKA